MGKHEIRLRRQRIASRGSERFRNYGSVLKQHEEGKRIKLITKIFTFFLITAALILIFIMVSRWEKRHEKSIKKTSLTEIINHTV